MNRTLAALALVLGIGAAVVPFGEHDARGAVSVIEVADRIRARRALRLIDLRDASDYADFHLPTAEHAGDRVLTDLVRPADTVVVYDGGDGSAREAWKRLRANVADSYWLADGPGEWMGTIVNPVLSTEASEEARAAFEFVASLSRYFGGLPRIGTPGDPERRVVPPAERRGCAF